MSLIIAPYNNAMRLGDESNSLSFNSYTQQICIDDAVVIDPDRFDNSVTNDGFADARELSKGGPSQTVAYTSRSLPIKYGAIGGSGKGSFVDLDKFKESDLNIFISVKVINQSINIKDALVFQGLSSVNAETFRSVFGDCFISGFLEGGEFNALVSLKVLNKDKRATVKAEAEMALSVGATDIKAIAKDDIDMSNLWSQTDTTIQVGWSGGGHIKPADQPWTIQTLMETAAKFPDLVASTSQRTYAILTKYETLQSYMALKPPDLKPLYYENAAIVTNSLLDAYMDYKNIYSTLGTHLLDIHAGKKEFVGWPSEAEDFAKTDTLSPITDERPFEATIEGLDLARRACRFQMVKIVREVAIIEENPDYAADEKRLEAIQSTTIFRERLPCVKDKGEVPYLTNGP
ncbi:hypothetical protein TGAM01_v209600 [Trichoderma gamsii]|uniref:Uncharacterized protein n=1 Tax=Trichoderma gamsii TaxID=398673 RepID=A0A2P4ZB94_9HYPO|nr:hypothetical protein TGAM01_v209600 [Trichoderma gamsii]PON21569.1 hypothetical protein TGAM01_v209600 [Trichoderma gamsii]